MELNWDETEAEDHPNWDMGSWKEKPTNLIDLIEMFFC